MTCSAEMFAQYRHYSNLRFLMIPLFLTAAGAVFLAYYTAWDTRISGSGELVIQSERMAKVDLNVGKNIDHIVIMWAPWIGIFTAGVFGFLEFALNKYITKYRLASMASLAHPLLDEVRTALESPTPFNKELVSNSILTMYALTAFFWAGVLLCKCDATCEQVRLCALFN